jgi:hypothetical protein
MVIFIVFFQLQTSKSTIFIKGFVYQCHSGLESTKVTIPLWRKSDDVSVLSFSFFLWKFWKFEIFLICFYFLEILKFIGILENFYILTFFNIATSPILLRILTESNSISNPVLVSVCGISGANNFIH